MTPEDDHQLRLAQRLVAQLRVALDLERVAFTGTLGRETTQPEFAERARQRFRSDPEFRALVMAAAAQAEVEELEEWRERCLPAPIVEEETC